MNTGHQNSSIIQKEIIAEIAEKIASKEIISNKIAEQEKLLSEGVLKINDGNATKITTNSFVVRTKDSKKIFDEKNDISCQGSDIPEGNIVNFGDDGKIRIFAPSGIELSVSDEAGTDDLKNEVRSKASISVPSGSTIRDAGKNTHVIYQNRIVLTIVDDRSDKKSKSKSAKYEEVIIPKKDTSFSPGTLSGSWVAWVEHNPSTEIKSFSADWMLPACPSVTNDYPYTVPNNIIFNGIEPSDSSIILQPVTACNYNDFSNEVGTDWENNWYGSSYIYSEFYSYDFHSTPIPLNSGNWVNGFVYYIEDANEWVVLLTTNGNTTYNQTSSLFYQIDPNDVNLVAAYEAWFNDPRFDYFPIPSDQAKCGNIKFEDLKAWDKYIHEIPITWIAHSTPDTLFHPGLTGISVDNITRAPDRITIYTSPPSASGAHFVTASDTSGRSPVSVALQDMSTNNPTAWGWNFGDESTSVEKNPSHTYFSTGPHTVKLIAANSAGSTTTTKTNYIVTAPQTVPITASAAAEGNITPSGSVNVALGEDQLFSITPLTGYGIDRVFVDGNAMGNISSYLFLDVHTAHTIHATFRLRPPIVNFTASPTTGHAPLSIRFNDTSIRSVTSWNWEFGDGNTSTLQNPAHTYGFAGNFT